MKTTIELPDDLIQKLKMRAVQDRCKLKDLTADLLRRGLRGHPRISPPVATAIIKDKKTGLPVIQCPAKPPLKRQITPEVTAQILLEQEAAWIHESA